MKLTIDKKTFLKALSHGQGVVEKHTTIPIMSHVLLDAEAGILKLTTTDMDLALVERIESVVELPGKTAASAHMLHDIVRKLPDGSEICLELNSDKSQMRITSGASDFNIACLPAEEFPQIAHAELPYRFKLPVATFRAVLDKSRFAMSTEETRYFLNGIHFHTIKNDAGELMLRSVATDAHRLACVEMSSPNEADDMPGIIVGRKTINELRKLLNEGDESIEIGLSDSRIEFLVGQAKLSSRLIDGTFPDYEKAIPHQNDKVAIVNAKEFAQAVDRVATIAVDKVRAIKVKVQSNKLLLSAASHEQGAAKEELPADFPYDDPIEIGFNASYLMDVADQINEDEAKLILSDSNSAAILRGVNDNRATFVLMPMRV